MPADDGGDALQAAHAAATPVPVVVRAGGGERLLREVADLIGDPRQ
jgi:hypothetical protein